MLFRFLIQSCFTRNRCSAIDVHIFSILLEAPVVEILPGLCLLLAAVEGAACETGDLHVSGLVGGLQSRHSTGAVLGRSGVEWLGLIELLAILRSLLIGVEILFCCPAS